MKETTVLHSIAYFLNTQKVHALHCKLQEEEMAVKVIDISFATQFQYLLRILLQRSSILRLAEDTMSVKMCGFPLFAMTR